MGAIAATLGSEESQLKVIPTAPRVKGVSPSGPITRIVISVPTTSLLVVLWILMPESSNAVMSWLISTLRDV